MLDHRRPKDHPLAPLLSAVHEFVTSRVYEMTEDTDAFHYLDADDDLYELGDRLLETLASQIDTLVDDRVRALIPVIEGLKDAKDGRLVDGPDLDADAASFGLDDSE